MKYLLAVFLSHCLLLGYLFCQFIFLYLFSVFFLWRGRFSTNSATNFLANV